MNKLKVAAVTTSRADYGLLYPLIKRMAEDEFFEVRIIAMGSHLSSFYGNTWGIIKQDDLCEVENIFMYPESDTEPDICNSIATGLREFSKLLSEKKQDLLVALGDRYELWPACIACAVHKVPIAHIHGGETTFGSMDETVRHSVTKMASIHFPAMEIYAKRIIRMGEDPERVFVVGALGIDNIKNHKLMCIDELSAYTGLDFKNGIALMTYHPETLEEYPSSSAQAEEILEALLETGLVTLITMPNADVGGRRIYEKVMQYTDNYPNRFRLIKNMGQSAYLSAMKYARLMIGNSSSGIIESASFKLPVVNIGDRQGGRFKPPNVIDCICSKDKISDSINKALSDDFIKSMAALKNPYGDGKTADRIIEKLKSVDFRSRSELLKKRFYDL